MSVNLGEVLLAAPPTKKTTHYSAPALDLPTRKTLGGGGGLLPDLQHGGQPDPRFGIREESRDEKNLQCRGRLRKSLNPFVEMSTHCQPWTCDS